MAKAINIVGLENKSEKCAETALRQGERGNMAKIKHIAIASQDPDKTAEFFKDVFDLEEVGKVESANASGYYLSDGNINLAILNFHSEVVAGEEFGTDYAGIHHIGFQVDDAEATEQRLRQKNSQALATTSTRPCTLEWVAATAG